MTGPLPCPLPEYRAKERIAAAVAASRFGGFRASGGRRAPSSHNGARQPTVPNHTDPREGPHMARYSLNEFVTRTAQQDRGQGLFELENERLLEINLNGQTWTKTGSMVA